MKIAFGMIVFNSDVVLKQVLESIYDFASQIVVAEGPVKWWQGQGYTTSTDDTNRILDTFPDPQKKLTVVHRQYANKTEQNNTYMSYVSNQNDYIWHIDADEVYKPEDLQKIARLLKERKLTQVQFKFCTFYGGFERKLKGWEENIAMPRVFKMYPGAHWERHRNPPLLWLPPGTKRWPERVLSHEETDAMGIRIYHYSYLSPNQVRDKIEYYKQHVCDDPSWIIDEYFEQVFVPWVQGTPQVRKGIEDKFNGVHEFTPQHRGGTRTEAFRGTHPAVIARDMENTKQKIQAQLRGRSLRVR